MFVSRGYSGYGLARLLACILGAHRCAPSHAAHASNDGKSIATTCEAPCWSRAFWSLLFNIQLSAVSLKEPENGRLTGRGFTSHWQTSSRPRHASAAPLLTGSAPQRSKTRFPLGRGATRKTSGHSQPRTAANSRRPCSSARTSGQWCGHPDVPEPLLLDGLECEALTNLGYEVGSDART